MTDKIGAIRTVDLAEYGHGEDGFAIEQFGYGNMPDPFWAIPAWDEMGMPILCGPFPTRKAAKAAIRLAASDLLLE